MEVFISIIMPVYNSESYLKDAIESCLEQTYQFSELILINDNSTDNSVTIINSFFELYPDKIRLFSFDENQGAAAARNKGIEMARGSYIVFADADDIQSKDRVEKVVQAFKKNTIDMVFNNCQMVDGQGGSLARDLGFPEKLNNRNGLLYSLQRNYFWTSLAAVKKDPAVFFDIDLERSEDYDLFLKLLYQGWKFNFIKEPLVKYRIHNNNDSANYKKSRDATIKILNKYTFKQLYKRLKQKGHPDLDIFFTFAVVCLIKKEPLKAIEYLNRVENLSADKKMENQELYFYLGVAYYQNLEMEKSYANFKQAYLLDQNSPALLNNLGVLEYIKNDNRVEAVKLIEKALTVKPGFLDAEDNLKRIQENKTPAKVTEKFLRKNFVHTNNYKL